MTAERLSETEIINKSRTEQPSAWHNVALFSLKRLSLLLLTVAITVYLTIIIANFGGYVDTIVESELEFAIGLSLRDSPLSAEEKEALFAERMEAARETAGLNKPLVLRTAVWLVDGLTLDWKLEKPWLYGFDFASNVTAGELILDNLARTLLIFGVSNVLLFGVAVFFALMLSRRHGGRLDKLFIWLSPISSAPAWVLGILLTVFALRVFGFSPGGTFAAFPEGFRFAQIVIFFRHLALPLLAIFLAGFFQSAYLWRSFFQVYRNEDYVDLAYAKGLSNGRIDRNYIIRPALPTLLTSFALLLAVLWQEMIALEYFFNIEGIGSLFIQALTNFDTALIVAIVTMFAYLIAIIVFALDICYLLIDPRVRIGSQQEQNHANQKPNWRFWQRRSRVQLSPLAETASTKQTRSRFQLSGLLATLKRWGCAIRTLVQGMRENPGTIFGLLVITGLIGVSVHTVINIPYREAVNLWRADNEVWLRNPQSAQPTWVNYFLFRDLPPTITFDSKSADAAKQVAQLDETLTDVIIPFTFEYDYGDFPQEIVLDMETQFVEKGPHVSVSWVWPDGSERELTSFQPNQSDSYFISRDDRLRRRLRSEAPLEALFLGSDGTATEPVPGTYTLRVQALLFEPDVDFDVKMTMLGQVHGLAGTDSQRRDLMIALLWGTPIALGFGLIAAFATSVGGMLIAALGAWFGGWVDRVVQFLTELNLILPFFPVALMVFVLYSRSILTILAVTVALTLFGSAVKTYRAAFLQIRSEPYILAAQVYGASHWRIVVRYMVPRIVTVLVPKLIILVPSYVFLEATLAFLGITDPYLPTWGKLVVEALSYGVYTNATHLVVVPLGLLFLTGFAFAMLGIGLERIFEPRLRER
ncbi:ABC transporter permease subunit [Candidatus Leptofilum sp.]|uniref:ABC transporter permease subunit n=1 Tax=Candidatus Leptofilum sp. TaxID=3241576 RepID=UPI003B5BEBF4